jgi:hypothetical protein
MTKFIKIIRFIKRHRAYGLAHFTVNTTTSEFIITANAPEHERE